MLQPNSLAFSQTCAHTLASFSFANTVFSFAPSRALAVPAWEPRLRHSLSFCGSFACSIKLDGVAAVEKTCGMNVDHCLSNGGGRLNVTVFSVPLSIHLVVVFLGIFHGRC